MKYQLCHSMALWLASFGTKKKNETHYGLLVFVYLFCLKSDFSVPLTLSSIQTFSFDPCIKSVLSSKRQPVIVRTNMPRSHCSLNNIMMWRSIL